MFGRTDAASSPDPLIQGAGHNGHDHLDAPSDCDGGPALVNEMLDVLPSWMKAADAPSGPHAA